jgi:hypothetical protein
MGEEDEGIATATGKSRKGPSPGTEPRRCERCNRFRVARGCEREIGTFAPAISEASSESGEREGQWGRGAKLSRDRSVLEKGHDLDENNNDSSNSDNFLKMEREGRDTETSTLEK